MEARTGAAAAAARTSAATATAKVSAVIFDWAGTIVDFGSCAPAEAFVEVFRRAGVTIDTATARGPMGKNKRDHISEIIYAPHVAAAWAAAKGAAPSEADIDALYAAFTPIQVDVARRLSTPIAGAVQAIDALRGRGVKVGSCSGYNAEIMAAVQEAAGAQGLSIAVMECAGPANGRPKPWMSTRVAEALDAYPLRTCVKVDDTLPGIGEGLNAGMWTVGVSASGNELALSEAEAAALAAGAHYVVPSVAELLPVIEDIERRLAAGESPV